MSNTDLIKIIALVWSQFFQWTLLKTQSLNLHASSSYFASTLRSQDFWAWNIQLTVRQ